MDSFCVRPAAPEERKTLEALQWRASLDKPRYRDQLLEHPDAIAIPEGQIESGGVFVAECEGTLGGFAAVVCEAGGHFELDGLFVEPALQRRGIGRLLIEHCMQYVRSRGGSALFVVANPDATEFYSALRFETIGSAETRFGPATRMRLTI